MIGTDPRTAMSPTPLLSRREAAARLGVSVTTLDKLRRRGEVRDTPVGGCVKIHSSELDRFLSPRS